MKNILLLPFISILIIIQSVNASDYVDNSTTETDFPINLTIIETLGTYTNPVTNDSGNFTHYLIGFEIFLENYSIEFEDSTPTGAVVEEYSYDPFGQRIKIMRNDTANTTIYTPFKELMRIVNSSGTYDFTYVYDGNTLVARVNPDGSKWYYHSDHLGSTSLITDQNGNVVEQTFYSPYGELLGGGTAEDKLLYTNQFKDFSCEYYYGARYYNPCNGMFIQPDPLIQNAYNPESLNRYSYVWGNPYKYYDSDGKEVKLAVRHVENTFDIGTHAYLDITPDNPEDFAGTEYENRFTLGGYPENGKLVIRLNAPSDFTPGKLDISSADYPMNIPTPQGMTDTEFIKSITSLSESYQASPNKVNYIWHAKLVGDNSNVAATSLLVGAGVQSDLIKNMNPPGYAPGLGEVNKMIAGGKSESIKSGLQTIKQSLEKVTDQSTRLLSDKFTQIQATICKTAFWC